MHKSNKRTTTNNHQTKEPNRNKVIGRWRGAQTDHDYTQAHTEREKQKTGVDLSQDNIRHQDTHTKEDGTRESNNVNPPPDTEGKKKRKNTFNKLTNKK